MPISTRSSNFADRFRAVFPSVLVLAGAAGYIGIDFWVEELPASVPGTVSPFIHAGLVAFQALALLLRNRYRLLVFAVVVLLDLVVLATTAGELGVGALAVLFASYAVARHAPRRAAWAALGSGAAATTLVGGVAMVAGSSEPLILLVLTAATRIALLYAVPAAVAEYVSGRERLDHALREQARMAEREQHDSAQRELRAERTALARELHDIAGHHLSGIIVSAQAATALTRSDPARARAMLQTLQDDARTTLADLRRTVGLLRSDDPDEEQSPGSPSPTPTLEGIRALVEAARARGQSVDYVVDGEPHTLGPLAETAAYRMVQESLANAARHAPGAACQVRLQYRADAVELAVTNAPGAGHRSALPVQGGYGLAGMAERAELIRARLVTGPTDDGGWRNRLVIPTDGRSET